MFFFFQSIYLTEDDSVEYFFNLIFFLFSEKQLTFADTTHPPYFNHLLFAR